MMGEVFISDERISGAMPRTGMKDSIPFEITYRHPAAVGCPAWCDVIIADAIRCRLSDEICEPPYARLFNLVAAIRKWRDDILTLTVMGEPIELKLPPDKTGIRYLLWTEKIGGLTIIMADALARVETWSSQGAEKGPSPNRPRPKR